MANCAACSPSARRSRRAATRARSILVPESAHGTNPATAAFAGYRVENIPATARGRVDLDALKARLGPDVAGGDDHQPQYLRPVRAGHDRDLRRGPRGRRPGLLRRRQFQRDRRPGAARRPRHRRDAHQPPQDLLDPAWRRRAGLGPGGLLRSADARSRRCRSSRSRAIIIALVEEETAGEHHGSSFGRMTAFHGQMGMFTRALAYILSHGADGLRQVSGGCGAQRQLHPAQPGGRARRAVRRRAARACTRPCSATTASPAASPRSISPRG